MATAWKTIRTSPDSTFRVPVHFEFVETLGAGAFGTVASFRDKRTGCEVALRKINNAFADLTDAKRYLQEVKLLRKMKHANVISIIDMLLPESRDFNDVYIGYEHMDTDLHTMIQSSQRLCEEHHQYLVYMILSALHYIHALNLIHRDLKPHNILVNSNDDVKICDFRMACATWMDTDLSDYVSTRWWRAPEVLLLPGGCTPSMDVWSVGCILAELIGRKPLFQGVDDVEQVQEIFQVMGTPAETELVFLPPLPCPARALVARMPSWPTRQWSDIYPNASNHAIEVLGSMLRVNHLHRTAVKDAMQLPYFEQMFSQEDLESGERVQTDAMIDDMTIPTRHWLRNAMYAECSRFHPEEARLRVVQLEPSFFADDGTMAVSCRALSGDVLATIIAQPGQCIDDLRAELSSQLDEPLELLQLINGDGKMLTAQEERGKDISLVVAGV